MFRPAGVHAVSFFGPAAEPACVELLERHQARQHRLTVVGSQQLLAVTAEQFGAAVQLGQAAALPDAGEAHAVGVIVSLHVEADEDLTPGVHVVSRRRAEQIAPGPLVLATGVPIVVGRLALDGEDVVALATTFLSRCHLQLLDDVLPVRAAARLDERISCGLPCGDGFGP